MFAFLKTFFSTATEAAPPPEPLPAHPAGQRREFSIAPLPDTSYAESLRLQEQGVPAQATGSAEIADLPDGIHPVTLAERAACEWALGRVDAARALLAAPDAPLCPATWAMRFEIERARKDRGAFEALAIDYAQREERSPPSWDLKPEMTALVSATRVLEAGPALTERNREALDEWVRAARGARDVVLDLSGVQDFDEPGCRLFLERLMRLRQLGLSCRITGTGRLAAMLDESIQPGLPVLPWLWRMRMEIVRAQGERERFDAMAMEFASLFEQSPPSWDEVPHVMLVASDPAPVPVPAATGGTSLHGEVLRASAETFAPFVAQAEVSGELVVDMNELRRMDFASAELLGETLFRLSRRGMRQKLVNVSSLVEPVLQLAGVTRYAMLSPRRLK